MYKDFIYNSIVSLSFCKLWREWQFFNQTWYSPEFYYYYVLKLSF